MPTAFDKINKEVKWYEPLNVQPVPQEPTFEEINAQVKWQKPEEVLPLAVIPPKPEEQPSAIALPFRGLTSGVLGVPETVGVATQYVGERLGIESLADIGETAQKYWGNLRERFGPPPDIAGKNVWDNPEILGKASFWLYNVPEMIPSFAVAALPAGVAGRAVLTGARAAGKLGTINIAGKAIEYVPENIKRLIKLAQMTTGGTVGGTLEASQTYKRRLAEGASEKEAARTGEAMFLITGLLNALAMPKILNLAGDKLRAKIVNRAGAGFWEGITEAGEEPGEVLSGLIGKYLSGEPLPKGIKIKEDLIDSLKQGLTVFPIAGVMGVGGATLLGQEVQTKPPPPPPPTTEDGKATTGADLDPKPEEGHIAEPKKRKVALEDAPVGFPAMEEERQALLGQLEAADKAIARAGAGLGVVPTVAETPTTEPPTEPPTTPPPVGPVVPPTTPPPTTPPVTEPPREPTEPTPEERAPEPRPRLREPTPEEWEDYRKRVEDYYDRLIKEQPENKDYWELAKKAELAKIPEARKQAIPTPEDLERERAKVKTELSDNEKESGIYPKGHVKWQGLAISIENPIGSVRTGKDDKGREWSTTMMADYGHILGTEGKDGDLMDVFLGPNLESEQVFVVNQKVPETGKFDEHKILLGWTNEQDAEQGYLANYEPGWQGVKSIATFDIEGFKNWLKETSALPKAKRVEAPVEKPEVEVEPTPEPEVPTKDIPSLIKAKDARGLAEAINLPEYAPLPIFVGERTVKTSRVGKDVSGTLIKRYTGAGFTESSRTEYPDGSVDVSFVFPPVAEKKKPKAKKKEKDWIASLTLEDFWARHQRFWHPTDGSSLSASHSGMAGGQHIEVHNVSPKNVTSFKGHYTLGQLKSILRRGKYVEAPVAEPEVEVEPKAPTKPEFTDWQARVRRIDKAVEKAGIPALTDTDDAVKFSQKATDKQIRASERFSKAYTRLAKKMLSEGQHDIAMGTATKGQFLREVVEAKKEPERFKKKPPAVKPKEPGVDEPWKNDTDLEPRAYQEKYPEKTVHEDWDRANSPRYSLEAAGDVLREFQKKTIDTGYIEQKLRQSSYLFTETHPDDVIGAARKHEPEKLNRLISQYEYQPTNTKAQEVAKDYILSLAKGEDAKARVFHDEILGNMEEWAKPKPTPKGEEKPKKAEPKEVTPITIKEAKKRWTSHTKKVLSDEARNAFREGEEWVEADGRIFVVSKDRKWAIAFHKDKKGNIYANHVASDTVPTEVKEKPKAPTKPKPQMGQVYIDKLGRIKFSEWREIKKGKDKGKIEIVHPRTKKKYIVDRDAIEVWPGGLKEAKPAEPEAPEAENIYDAIKQAEFGPELADWIIGNSESASYRAIAERIKPFISEGLKIIVVTKGKRTKGGTSASFRRKAKATFHPNWRGSEVIWVKDESFGKHANGMTEKTALHELIHGATSRAIFRGLLKKNKGTPLHDAVQGLSGLTDIVNDFLSKKDHDEATAKLIEKFPYTRRHKKIKNTKELVAHGLTDSRFQDILKAIPVERKKSAWNKFVEILSQIFGINPTDQTAFTELLISTENLLEVIEGKTKPTKPAEPTPTAPAKEKPLTLAQQKKYLLGEIDKAIEKARISGTVTDEQVKLFQKYTGLEGDEFARWVYEGQEIADTPTMVTFKVPGGATYNVVNTKDKLIEFRNKTKKEYPTGRKVKPKIPQEPLLTVKEFAENEVSFRDNVQDAIDYVKGIAELGWTDAEKKWYNSIVEYMEKHRERLVREHTTAPKEEKRKADYYRKARDDAEAKPIGNILEEELQLLNQIEDGEGFSVEVPRVKRERLMSFIETGNLGDIQVTTIKDPDGELGSNTYSFQRPYGIILYEERTGKLYAEPSIAEFSVISVVEGTMGMKMEGEAIERTIDIISNDTVGSYPATTIVNELFQNSADAFLEVPKQKDRKIDISLTPNEKGEEVYSFSDNAVGMSREDVEERFLSVGAIGKAGDTTSGGYGFAKTCFLLWPKFIVLHTRKLRKDGNIEYTTFSATPDEIRNKTTNVKTEIQTPEEDNKPGTTLILTLPDDANRDETRSRTKHYIENLRVKPAIEVTFDDGVWGKKKHTTKLFSEFPKKYKTDTIKDGKNIAKIYYIERKGQRTGWGGKFSIDGKTYNKGMEVYVRISAWNLPDLMYAPGFEVAIDFTKTAKPEEKDYPFLDNRKSIKDSVVEKVREHVINKTKSIDEQKLAEDIQAMNEMVAEAPVLSGIKVLIPFKSKTDVKKARKLFEKNKVLFEDLAKIYKMYTDKLRDIGEKDIELAVTVDPGVHGSRTNPLVTGYELYCINPFSVTDMLLLSDGFIKAVASGEDSIRMQADNMVETLVHEFGHNRVQNHYEEFTKEHGRLAMVMGFRYLGRLAHETYTFFETHQDRIKRITKSLKSLGKSGSRFHSADKSEIKSGVLAKRKEGLVQEGAPGTEVEPTRLAVPEEPETMLQVKGYYKYPKEKFIGKFPEDASDRVLNAYFKRRRKWLADVQRAISEGKINPEEAQKLGYHAVGGEKWQEMPKVLYHVTIAKTAVKEAGKLKTRDELKREKVGLGGGPEDMISLTSDKNVAKNIQRAFLEVNAVLNEKISIQKLLDDAYLGKNADSGWLNDAIGYYKKGWKRGDDYPIAIKELLEKKHYETAFMPKLPEEKEGFEPIRAPSGEPFIGGDGKERYFMFRRDITPKEFREKVLSFYNTWAWMRESRGGPEYPLFFGADAEILAKSDVKDIRILELKPKEGAKGFPVGSLSEWRTASGEALEMVTRLTDQAPTTTHPTITTSELKNVQRAISVVGQALKDAGLHKQLNRLRLEFKPLIQLRGKNLQRTLKEHAENKLERLKAEDKKDLTDADKATISDLEAKLKDPKHKWTEGDLDITRVLEATTILNDLMAEIQFAIEGVDPKQLRRTAIHASWHVIKRMMPQADQDAISEHFKNEEAEADGWGDFVEKKTEAMKMFPRAVRRAFMRLQRLFRKIRKALTGKGFDTMEDIFGRAMMGAYRGGFLTGVPVTAQAMMPSTQMQKQILSEEAKTKNFANYMKGSVVTKTGKPWKKAGDELVVYHGTATIDFSTFDVDRGDFGTHFGIAKQAEDASDWGTQGQRIIPAYLAIQNPIRLIDYGHWEPSAYIDQLRNKGAITKEQYDRWDDDIVTGDKTNQEINKEVRSALLENGYDGVIYLNRREGVGILPATETKGGKDINELTDEEYLSYRPEARDSYIAFHPTQIKSIFNVGTWSPETADIRFQLHGWHGKTTPGPLAGGKFTPEMVGSGAGLALGWGVYISEEEGVGRFYADIGGNPVLQVDGKTVHNRFIKTAMDALVSDGQPINLATLEQRIEDIIDESRHYGKEDEAKSYENALKIVVDPKAKMLGGERRLYQVTLGKDLDEFEWLRWDEEPTAKQKKMILDAVKAEIKKQDFAFGHYADELDQVDSYIKDWNGSTIYSWMENNFKNKRKASEFLLRAGIEGVKAPVGYFGGGGRGVTEGKFNYVIFDPSKIQITQETMFAVGEKTPLALRWVKTSTGNYTAQATYTVPKRKKPFTEKLWITPKPYGKKGKYWLRGNGKINEILRNENRRLHNSLKDAKRVAEQEYLKLATEVGRETMLTFAGAEALTADKNKLTDASERIKRGEDADTVLEETGWFINQYDGMWRFEIDDSKAKLKDVKWKTTIKPMHGEPYEGIRYHKLSDVLSHPELFKAYPELKNYEIRYNPDLSTSSYRGREIQIGGPKENFKANLIHEIQHAVQEIEGFARGGSEFTGVLAPEFARMEKVLIDEAKDIDRKVEDYVAQKQEGGDKRNVGDIRDEFWDKNENLFKRREELTQEIFDFPTKYAHENYRRLAGEIEARESASRFRMGIPERLVSRPFEGAIPPEEAIVRFGEAGVAMSEAQSLSRSKRFAEKGIKTAIRDNRTGKIYRPQNELEERFHPAIFDRVTAEDKNINPDDLDVGFLTPKGEYVDRKTWFEKGEDAFAGIEFEPETQLVIDEESVRLRGGGTEFVDPSLEYRKRKNIELIEEALQQPLSPERAKELDRALKRSAVQRMPPVKGTLGQPRRPGETMLSVEDKEAQTLLSQGEFTDAQFRVEEPDLTGNIKNTLERISGKRPKKTKAQRFKEHLDDVKVNWQTRAINRHNPLKVLGKSIQMLFSLETNIGATLETFFRHGKIEVDPESKWVIINDRFNGYLEWLKTLDQKDLENDKWMWRIVAERSERLAKQKVKIKGKWRSKEVWITPEERKQIFEWTGDAPATGKYNTWEDLNKDFQEYNKSILDLAVAFGLINQHKRDQWEQFWYVPFYRIFEDERTREQYMLSPKPSKRFIDARIKRLVGAEAGIGDPIENVIKSWTHLIHESIKNRAWMEAFDACQDIGVDLLEEVKKSEMQKIIGGKKVTTWAVVKEGYPTKKGATKARTIETSREEAERWARIYEEKSKGKDRYEVVQRTEKTTFFRELPEHNILSFMRDGRPVYFKVHDMEMYMAMTNMNQKKYEGLIFKFFRGAKRLLTWGATNTPPFMARNMIRDSTQAYVMVPKFKPFWDSFKGFVKVLRQDEDFIKVASGGGLFLGGQYRADDAEAMKKYIDRTIKKEGRGAKARILDTPQKLYDFWSRLVSSSENASRVMIYAHNRELGRNHLESAFEAKDFLDFQKRGDSESIQLLIQILPFLNARMQGLYKIGDVAYNVPKTQRLLKNRFFPQAGFARRGAIMAGVTMLLWAMNKDRDEWKKLEDWEKWMYYHFWVGDKHYRIPKGFETGAIFSTLFEAAADTMTEEEDFGYFADFLKHTMMDTFAFNPVPQLMRPAIEQWANKVMFTGRPIEGQRLQALELGERADIWTSETMKLAGKLGIPPKRAEALVRGYMAGMGMYMLGAADIVLHHVGDFPPDPKWTIEDYPLLGRFVGRDAPSRHTKYMTRFYDTMRELDQLVGTINYYKRTGDLEKAHALFGKKRKRLRTKKSLNSIRTRLRRIGHRIQRVYYSNLSPADKRKRLDVLLKRRNQLIKRGYDIIQESK